ncbi:MAG: hypothetical protein C0493_11025 [Kytococcus sp.]|nr:hypothetical protein [Kytococcus sp.]
MQGRVVRVGDERVVVRVEGPLRATGVEEGDDAQALQLGVVRGARQGLLDVLERRVVEPSRQVEAHALARDVQVVVVHAPETRARGAAPGRAHLGRGGSSPPGGRRSR